MKEIFIEDPLLHGLLVKKRPVHIQYYLHGCSISGLCQREERYKIIHGIHFPLHFSDD